MSQAFSCAEDRTLLQALTDAGIFLEANCGGRGTCGKCKIQVLRGKVKGSDNLPAIPQSDNTFLACQVYPCEDVLVKLKETEVSAKGSITEKFTSDDQPLLKKVVVVPEYPTLENHYSLQEMIGCAMDMTGSVLTKGNLLKQLASILDTGTQRITVVLVDDEIIAIEAGNTADLLFGVAFDIGTTTVVGMLVDINEKKILTSCSKTNPQAAFGADVISRIHAAGVAGGLEAEASAIRQCLNQIIEELCVLAHVSQDHIYAATIAGNSTMEHLLMEISPSSLTRKPYASVFKHITPLSPAEIDLNINAFGKVVLLPNIAGFIGADTVAAVLGTGQDISTDQSLLIDLGTNGEMVIGNREKLWACSTACGPAFEGSHIRDGMRATSGAIADVAITDDVRVKTIGDCKPAGICGSGIVKAIAELLKKKIITSTGRLNKNIEEHLPDILVRRLQNKNNQWEFVLVEGKDSSTGADISITQADIRQIQLVKSSICSGIQILLEKANPRQEISIFLAGAFGNYIDTESALIIGMLPHFNRKMIQSVGNAAGVGAVCALLSKDKLARCSSIADNVNYVELAAHPDFQAIFYANLSFPEVNG